MIRITLLILILSFGCSSNNEELYKKATELEENSENKEAIKIYTSILENDSNEDLARFRRSQVYVSMELPDMAFKDLNYLIEKEPENKRWNAFIHYHRAELNFKTRNYQKAVNDYLETFKWKIDPSIYMVLGDAFFELSELDSAISYYKTGAKVQHENPKYFNRIGTAYSELKNHEKAIDYYSKAIELDSLNAVYYGNRAGSYSELKLLELALKDCEQVLSDTLKYKNYQIVQEVYEHLMSNKSEKVSNKTYE